ncbi:thioredoxin-like protein [Cokeromyces recurvatus]|uniref:thioredoxin-like protein n=1 Tax=Cokeromyces recurvatus TaxID=90255 RepID=UPI00221FED5D|nr:thioredoxin-like protein [Cokeromyces recurvatus]KAI7898323.1 thioredoxin-like protein [Cokeromyces recurvatus]
MSVAQQIVEEFIKNNAVVIFGKSYCPYCKRAKALLKDLGIEFVDIEIDLHPDGKQIQEYLFEKTGQRTVPNIFINQQHVGGCDDLLNANSNGTLEKLLNKQ